MAYFTINLQRQVNSFWRKKIHQADAEMRLYTSGKEIRDYLNNRASLNTVGFVIRRHLQNAMPELLLSVSHATGEVPADLRNNLNVPWPKKFNTELARELFLLAKKQKVSISRNTWIDYLDDAPLKMYKDTPFKVAFVLGMSVNTTEELLMACGQDTYCFRNADHFIYYYCQNRPVPYDWDHAKKLITEYRNSVKKNVYTAVDASYGMTFSMKQALDSMLSSSSSDVTSDGQLIQYMLANQTEFSGLSLSARENFLRMSQYLAVLYPTYTKIVSRKNPLTGELETTSFETPVTIMEDHYPKLSDLVRALFSTGGWLPTTIGKASEADGSKRRTASSLERRAAANNIEYQRAPIDEEVDRPFLQSIQYFVDTYTHHLDAIERVFRKPANPGNVERRDVILFTYFFIRRYPELLQDEEYYGLDLDKLTALAYGDSSIDSVMDSLMEDLYILNGDWDDDYDQDADTPRYLQLFNNVLRHFGMKEMYMPNPFDRFITMSLFAEDPDFFTEAVLWNTVSDEEAPQEEPEEEVTEELKKAPAAVAPRPLFISNPMEYPYKIGPEGNKTYLSSYLYRKETDEYITLNKNCFVFGRRSRKPSPGLQDYGFPTEDRSVSRRHALILFYHGSYYLADISSGNSTWLNEVHLRSNGFNNADPNAAVTIPFAYALENHNQIRIGQEVFEFIES